jgi:Flp pilus assembly protein TadD
MRMFALLVAAVLIAVPGTPRAASDTSSPAPVSTPLGKAQAAIEAGDFTGAVPLLERAVGDEPENADAWNLLGYAKRKTGDVAAAEQAYGRALDLDDEHTGALEYLGELYVQTGRTEEARALLVRLDKACFFSCEEYDDLKRAIETGRVD